MDEADRRVLKARRDVKALAAFFGPLPSPQVERVREAEQIIQDRRYVDGKVNLIAQRLSGLCDRCLNSGREVPAVVDGATTTTVPRVVRVADHHQVLAEELTRANQWALMCMEHFSTDGIGLGLGIGQVYVYAPFVDWPAAAYHLKVVSSQSRP